MRKLGRIAIKTVRFTSWPLLLLILAYIATGFAMSGEYGFGALMGAKTALAIHRWMHALLLVLFPVHAVAGIFLALRRWRWIK